MTAPLHVNRFTLCRPVRVREGEPKLRGQYRYDGILLDVFSFDLSRDRIGVVFRPAARTLLWPPESVMELSRVDELARDFEGLWTAPDGKKWMIRATLTTPPTLRSEQDSRYGYFSCMLERIRP